MTPTSNKTTLTMTTKDDSTTPDTVLFGSLPYTISDFFGESIDSCLVEFIADLPSKGHNLLSTLRRVYFRNVDVLESYLVRNIFSIQSLPPTRRNKIVQAYLKGEVPSTETKEFPTTNIESYDYPTEIPSSQDVQSLQQETKELRLKLREARRRRKDLLTKLEGLVQANQAVNGVVGALQVVPSEDEIASVVMDKDRLEELQASASILTEKLQEEKRERPELEDEVDLNAKRTKLSLEQQYKENRENTRTQSSMTKVVTEFLK
jgi:hypothetical protein